MIPVIETKSTAEIREFQENKLSNLLEYLNTNSPFYREKFLKEKIDIRKINTLEHLKSISFTSKEDLQLRNHDFICVSPNKIIDYITTSGTLGDPVTFAATENDLERLAYNEAISFACAGANSNDIYQLMVTLDRRFMAGLAYFMGLRKLGAGIVRSGPGNPELQFDTLKRINPTAFVTVPSFLIKLIEYAENKGVDINATTVKSAVCIGEPIRNNDFTYNKLGKQITDKWNIKLFSTYASTEMGAAFSECTFGCGCHHHPELLIVELLDEHGNDVEPGTPGEVVITTLGVEGMPLLRFKTGDICIHDTEPCKCGRNTIRLGPVIGRKKQMIKYKGTTLYPPSLYDILNDLHEVENYVVEVSTNQMDTDEILIKIGVNNPDELLEKKIKDHFRAKLRVAPSIAFLLPAEIAKLQFPESARKPMLFFDKRIR
ncbi:MAG: AMP-binding protein [Bacteroidales bacterium]|nr:AMP-binding protein [Bacteroidales bacterium]